LHDQLASLSRHAQLMCCFSAVAELLVNVRSDLEILSGSLLTAPVEPPKRVPVLPTAVPAVRRSAEMLQAPQHSPVVAKRPPPAVYPPATRHSGNGNVPQAPQRSPVTKRPPPAVDPPTTKQSVNGNVLQPSRPAPVPGQRAPPPKLPVCFVSFFINFFHFGQVFARDSIYAIARICYHPSVRLSVCLSHWWISQKRLKLGSCNFHHQVAP